MATLLTTIAPEFAPLTQTNYLNRIIKDAQQPNHVWRKVASSEMEVYPSKIGLPEIITVRGLKAPKITPNNVSTPSDLNAGMTSRSTPYEAFTITVDRYDDMDTIDMFARHLPIADKYVETLITIVQGAESSQDFIARNALYDAYTATNTFSLGNTSATALHVDDVRRFQPYTGAQGEVATANVVVNGNTYVLSAVTFDSTNVSSLAFTDGSSFDGSGLFGRSGTLTFTTNLAAADKADGVSVVAYNAPTMIIANSRATVNALQSGDFMKMKEIQRARNVLTNNNMLKPGEKAMMYANPNALYGLYRDPEFQYLYRSAYASDTYTSGNVADLLGVSIMEVTSAPIQMIGNLEVHRSMIVAPGALIEARKTDDMVSQEVAGPVHVTVNDNIAIMTTAPIDAAGQFVRIAALQFVGYAARTDRLVTPAVIPTATPANYKRAVVLVSTAN